MEKISSNIVRRRKQLNMSQSDLANELCRVGYECNNVKVSKWQNDLTAVPIEALVPLCKALRCSVSNLITGQNEHTQKIVRMCEQILALDDAELDILYQWAVHFPGDNHAAIQLAGMYLSLPIQKRLDTACMILDQYYECKRKGKLLNHPTPNDQYVKNEYDHLMKLIGGETYESSLL